MNAFEFSDTKGLYKRIKTSVQSRIEMRQSLHEIGFQLATETRLKLTTSNQCSKRVLCVVILRGGAMLYPGFLAEFIDADFCMLGVQRSDGGNGEAVCTYCSPLDCDRYDLAIFLDCIAATGGTVLAASRFLNARCVIDSHLASVVCCSSLGAKVLVDSHIGVVGFSLSEDMAGNVVTPDFGELDAGDLFFRAEARQLQPLITANN